MAGPKAELCQVLMLRESGAGTGTDVGEVFGPCLGGICGRRGTAPVCLTCHWVTLVGGMPGKTEFFCRNWFPRR